MAKNPMQTAGAYGILKAVKENTNSAMEELDFSVSIDKSVYAISMSQDWEFTFIHFLDAYEILHAKGPFTNT